MPETIQEPIACTLQAGDLKARLESIAELNMSALLADHRDDLRLELTYAGSARDLVRAMVEGERACCAFLDFNVSETDDTVKVVVVAPEAAREAAETVFGQFRSRATFEAPQILDRESCRDTASGGSLAVRPRGGRLTGKVVGATAAVAATGAVACGVCCVLPFALPAAVLAIGGGTMAWFAQNQGEITRVAAVAVFAAWGWVGYHTHRTRTRPAIATLLAVGFATVMLVSALQWRLLEPVAFPLIGK